MAAKRIVKLMLIIIATQYKVKVLNAILLIFKFSMNTA
jgi:hypothetical protein